MSKLSYVRFGTYIVVAVVVVMLWRRPSGVIEVSLVESGYEAVVRSLLKRSSEIPLESVSIGGRFPELRPVNGLPDGLSWRFQDGPDFYIWRGLDEGSKSGVGLYFGHWPDFDGDVSRVEVGRVGRDKVVWCRTNDHTRGFRAECLFVYLHDRKSIPLKIHVWVYGESEAEVNRFSSKLSTLEFHEWKNEPNTDKERDGASASHTSP